MTELELERYFGVRTFEDGKLLFLCGLHEVYSHIMLRPNLYTVESRFLEPSVSRTSRYLEPNLVSLGFTSLELYNFTPDFSNPRFLETPDNSNQFFSPWDKLTLDNSNLRKFRNNLLRMSITSTPLNKLTLPDKLFSHNKQATNLSSVCKVQWLPRITEQKFPYLIVFLKLLPQYIDKFRCLLTQCELRHAISVPVQPPKWCA